MNNTKIGVPLGLAGPFVSTAALSYGANAVNTVLFEVSGFSVTLNNVLWDLVSGINGSHVGFGIYTVTPGSATRGVMLADTGPVNSQIADQGLKITPFLTPVTLPCGQYCMAFTTDSASVTALTVNIGAIVPYNGTPEIFLGTAANASVAGQLPALLGVITASNSLKFPTMMLSN